MLTASPNSSSPTQSAAANFFARINSGSSAAPGAHPRSFSVSAADGPPPNVSSGDTCAPPAAGGDLRRAVSLRGPPGMSSFSAAGSDLASPPGSVISGYTPPAASRHALFSHHALPPQQFTRPFSPMSDPGAAEVIMNDAPFDNSLFPPSPTGSTLSSAGTGTFSPASAFLLNFGRGRAMSIAGLPEEPLLPDAQGARVLEYTLGKVLGRGGFSTVREATHRQTGEVFACKIVKRDDLSSESGSVESFEDEIRIWQELPEHPSLLPLLEMHRTSYATFMFMPLLAGGSLLDVLVREGGGDKTARKWFPGVVAAVAALHEGYPGFGGNMLHGDLKLDNFITDTTGGVRLGDFGMARKIIEANVPKTPIPVHIMGRPRLSSAPNIQGIPGHHHHHRGRQMSRSPNRRRDTFATSADLAPNPSNPMPSASLPYAPPELLCSTPGACSLKQDIWAIGVILYALLAGRLPFTDSFDPRLQMKILRGQYEDPAHVGHEWTAVLHGCLERDLRARWDIRRLRESDAVTGWREVARHPKSRSRSRARLAPDSPGLSEGGTFIPRSRDRSRSRLRGGGHGHASSIGSTHSHHRGPSHHDLPSPMLDEHEARFLRRPGMESRSRSASGTRVTRARMSGDVHSLLSTSSDDRLIAALTEVSITRGRQAFRTDERERDDSASSLHVPSGTASRDSRSPSGSRPHSFQSPSTPSVGHIQPQMDDHHRARSRTRLDGVQVPVPGSGPPTVREQHWHRGHGGSDQNTPRSRGSPSWAAPERRPPTLGVELDAVDEEERGRKGRSPIPPPTDRSRSRRRMMEWEQK